MKSFLQSNRVFFFTFIVFLLLGGILLLFIDKGDAILFFSENRSYFGDLFFKYTTKLGEEPAYILAMILLLFIRIRHLLLIPLLGIFVTVLSYSLKSFFGVFRPAAFFEHQGLLEQINLIEGVKLYVGQNSFPSGHTMSAFALYGLLAFLIPKKKGVGFLLFFIAFLVGLSRVYIVQHFWEDVYVGGILGVVLASLFWFTQKNLFSDTSKKWWNKSVLEWKGKEELRA